MLPSKDDVTLEDELNYRVYQVATITMRVTDLIVIGNCITGVLVSKNVPMEPEKNYAVRINTIDGEYDIEVNTVMNAGNKLIFTESLLAETCALKPHDFCLFVEVVRETLTRQSADKLAVYQ